MDSPPLAPLRPFTPAKLISTTQQRPGSASSFASIQSSAGHRHSLYSNRRLSNSSRFSNGFDDPSSPLDQRGKGLGGMGTLADELDSADDEEWEQEETTFMEDTQEETSHSRHSVTSSANGSPAKQHPTDGSRDSGIDVTGYNQGLGPRQKPSNTPAATTTTSSPELAEAEFSLELDAAVSDIAALAQASALPRADTTARTLAALRDLPPQSNLETLTQRLVTSSNSIAASTAAQTRALAGLVAAVFPPLYLLPFAPPPPLSAAEVDELLAAQVGPLLESAPQRVPDPSVAAQFAKLGRDGTDLSAALATLLDSLQLGRQLAAGAARSLKVVSGMVLELRRESERVEEARFLLEREGWDEKLGGRWCAQQCREVVGGFERFADEMRAGIAGGVA